MVFYNPEIYFEKKRVSNVYKIEYSENFKWDKRIIEYN